MIVAGVVWAIGVVCALAMFTFANHGAEGPEERYSGLEIGLCAVCWPVVVLILVGIEVCVRLKRGRS